MSNEQYVREIERLNDIIRHRLETEIGLRQTDHDEELAQHRALLKEKIDQLDAERSRANAREAELTRVRSLAQDADFLR
jgi:phage host-nuclease inhibitor protein Gam